jgi:hypothetical protein
MDRSGKTVLRRFAEFCMRLGSSTDRASLIALDLPGQFD